MTWELRLGDWRTALESVECDALITDPPYSEKTHSGHNAGVEAGRRDGDAALYQTPLHYPHWGRDDVFAFVRHWSPRVRGWIAAMSDHNLIPIWTDAFADAGRYAFAPIPCVIRAMTLRMAGDGPSSWAVYLNVARPKTREMATWGTLPGAYVVTRDPGYIGSKPLDLMRAIVRDYSRPGDMVCDPCAGHATTLVAADSLARNAIGAEILPDTYAAAMKRLNGPRQIEMFAGSGREAAANEETKPGRKHVCTGE